MRSTPFAAAAVLVLGLPLCSQSRPGPHPAAEPATGRFPLVFEANGGRHDGDAAFVARGRGYQMFVTRDGSGLALRHPNADGFAAALRTRFVGANPAPAIRGESEQPTRVHYLIGADASEWSTDNRTFGRVRYHEVWPGIDLVMYGRGGELEYDFVVAPGADPRAIRLAHDGVDALELQSGGDLVLRVGDGELVQSAPVIYQGEGADRRPVSGRFALHDDGSVGFEVDTYDRARSLVIDPVLVYASYLGGNGFEEALIAVATDAQGCAYVCGYTDSTDLPGTAGAFQPAKASGSKDAMVAKISPDGSTLMWCTYLGGSTSASPSSAWDDDRAFAIAVDASGHAYVGGKTGCLDFPTTAGAFDTTYVPEYGFDGFVAKLTPDGSGLVYSTLLGNTGNDMVLGLDIDASGHAYATGQAHWQFPVTSGAFQTAANSALWATAFVTKLAPDGGSLVYSTFVGGLSSPGVGGTYGTDIAVDALGRAYIGGHTYTTNFPTPNGYQTTLAGFSDGFLARLSADGSTLEYGTYLGGSDVEGSEQRLGGIAADDSGRAWFVNESTSTDYPVSASAFQPGRSTGIWDRNAVVTCLDTDQSGAASMLWSTYFGGGQDTAFDVETDGAGNAYVLGHTSKWVPLVNPWPTELGCGELFVTVFDATGNVPFSSYIGGTGCESYSSADTAGMTLDDAGNVYIVGRTGSPDLATPGAFQTTNPANPTAPVAGFIAKFAAMTSNASYQVRTPCTGTPIPDSLIPVSGPVVGQTLSVAIGDPTGARNWTPGGAVTFWLLSAAPGPSYPCGLPISNWGELMLSAAPPNFWISGQVGGGYKWDTVYSIPLPNDPIFDGVTLYTQGLIHDAGTPQVALTNALDLTLGM